ncbi:MAG: hypothetical protein ACR5LA_11250 [Wolbachia sp.]
MKIVKVSFQYWDLVSPYDGVIPMLGSHFTPYDGIIQVALSCHPSA